MSGLAPIFAELKANSGQFMSQLGAARAEVAKLVTGAGESQKNIRLVGDGMLHMAGQVGISAPQLSQCMYLIESAGFQGLQGLLVLRAAEPEARRVAAQVAAARSGS